MGRSKKEKEKEKEKNPHHPSVDSPSLERLQAALGPAFSHSRIADKLHRLKLQYHKFARTKSLLKTPHRPRHLGQIPRTHNQQRSPATTSEGVDLKHFPLVVSEFSRHFPGNGVWKKGLRQMEGMNQSWALLHSQEAELNWNYTHF